MSNKDGGNAIKVTGRMLLVIIALIALIPVCGCITPGMKFVKEFGVEGKGNGELSGPTDLAVNSKGDLYVCDTKNNRVCVFNNGGEFVKSLAGTNMNAPYGIGIDKSDNVFVADTGNNRVIKFDASGRFVHEIYSTVKLGQQKDPNNSLKMPYDVAAMYDGRLFIVDVSNRLLVYESTGVCSQKLGGKGAGSGNFDVPTRVATNVVESPDKQFYVYVAESFNSRVTKFNAEFKPLYDLKEKTMFQFLRDPRGLAMLPDKSIIVTDCGSVPIVAYSSQGVIEGKGGSFGTGRGKILSPAGVAVDVARKRVYVSDQLQHKILVYNLHKEIAKEGAGE